MKQVFIYIWAKLSPIYFTMEKITKANYIRLQRKICNPQVIITVNQLAAEWGVKPEEACYRILNETIMKEHLKRKNTNQ